MEGAANEISEECPNCGRKINTSDSRLIKDTCGHEKCRMCLLYEEQGCKTCSQLHEPSPNHSGSNGEQYAVRTPGQQSLGVIEKIPEETMDTSAGRDAGQAEKNILNKITVSSNNKPKKSTNRSHIVTIDGTPERYKCTLCLKIFRNKKGKCYHDVCLTGIQPYNCSICDRSFVKKSHFEYHERVHSGYRPFKCELCPKAFPQKNKLNRHMQCHSAEKRFLCTSCGKRYSKKDDLKSHMMIHSGKMPYKCSICAKAFRVKTSLNRHMQIHSTDRPHICGDCGKSFKDKSLLIRHKRIHGKDRPYSCAHCPKLFLSKSELRRHLSTHTDVKPFSCTFCQTSFRRKDNLSRHIRHHHHHHHHHHHQSGNVDARQTDDNAPKQLSAHNNNNNHNNSSKNNKSERKMVQTSVDSNKKANHKDKSKKVTTTTTKPAAIVYQVSCNDSKTQINSRIDSQGNITPVIRAPGELSNAVPVINGPISTRKPETSKRTVLTYTEPIPIAEAVVINQRIEEKLYPQNHSVTNNSSFFRDNSKRQTHIACITALPPLRQNHPIRASPSVSRQPVTNRKLSDSNYLPPKNGTLIELKSSAPIVTADNAVQEDDKTNKKCSIIVDETIIGDSIQSERTNCVSTIKENFISNHTALDLNDCQNKPSETHWRRRTLQNFKTHLN